MRLFFALLLAAALPWLLRPSDAYGGEAPHFTRKAPRAPYAKAPPAPAAKAPPAPSTAGSSKPAAAAGAHPSTGAAGRVAASDDRIESRTGTETRSSAGPASATVSGPGWTVVSADRSYGARDVRARRWWAWPMVLTLYVIIFLICVYTARHYFFTLNRLFGRQRHPYLTIDTAVWPDVTVLIPAHNEEAVIDMLLEALIEADYPPERLSIVPINDRSTDRTREILDDFQARHPDRVFPFHRTTGKPGKAAALRDAAERVETEVMLVFDADYVPGRDLIKHLVAPFLDPAVGAVMGRVVPVNTQRNLLTRLMELERCGGYQVDQQARMNLQLVPQYGGTVGGVRVSAMREVGGWNDESLAEDTDMTFRLVLGGWRIVYSNRYECYEEVPETWPVRVHQIRRWAQGHTQAALDYSWRLLTARGLSLKQRIDGFLLLGVYWMAPALLLGWVLATILFYLDVHPVEGLVAVLAVASYNTIGNFAAFFEIAAAVRLDGMQRRIRILPLNILNFVVSMLTVSGAILRHLVNRLFNRELHWQKTERFRAHGLDEEAAR